MFQAVLLWRLALAHPTGTDHRFFDSEDPHHRCTLVTYNAGISACEKGEQWQRALALLSEMWEATLRPSVTSYGAGMSACNKGRQLTRALSLFRDMRESKLEFNVTV